MALILAGPAVLSTSDDRPLQRHLMIGRDGVQSELADRLEIGIARLRQAAAEFFQLLVDVIDGRLPRRFGFFPKRVEFG